VNGNPLAAAPPSAPRWKSGEPTPRALIDYDFNSVLAAPPRRRIVLWLMAGLFAAAAAALALARVDIVVSANGRLATTDSEIVVQPLETSVVRAIDVHMGDQVKAGEVLATLDPTFTEADENELSAKLSRLQATDDRIAAELAGTIYDPPGPNPDELTQRDIFRKRHDEYTARLAALDRKTEEYGANLAAHQTEAKGLQQQIQLAQQAEGIYQALVAKDLASKLKLIETTQRRVEAQSRRDTSEGEQQQLRDEIAAATAEREAFVDEWRRKLAEAMAETRGDLEATAAQLSKARLRHRMAVLRAPRDSIVLAVAERAEGAVVQPAEPLFRLVPADVPLVAEVEIDTRDVARIRIGDRVTLKFQALPWQQYGLADGVLKALAPDTVDDGSRAAPGVAQAPDFETRLPQSPIHYLARVALTRKSFRNLPQGFALRPGMRLVADIKIGRRSILQYVLNPLTRVVNDSLHEP
jgi:membrane fusion protein, hemolysin D